MFGTVYTGINLSVAYDTGFDQLRVGYAEVTAVEDCDCGNLGCTVRIVRYEKAGGAGETFGYFYSNGQRVGEGENVTIAPGQPSAPPPPPLDPWAPSQPTYPSAFFVVWCPTAKNPRVRHKTQDDANAEAARLAKLNPTKEFYVLKTTVMKQMPKPVNPPVETTIYF